MKTIITILASLAFAALISAQTPPVVTIDSASNCYINGTNAGQPADVIANNPALAPAVQKALVAFVANVNATIATNAKAASDAAAATVKAGQDAATKQVADAQAAVAAQIAALQKQVADLQAQLAAATAKPTFTPVPIVTPTSSP